MPTGAPVSNGIIRHICKMFLLDEQGFRLNARKANDAEPFLGVSANANGKRLSYAGLTGNDIAE